MAGARHAIVLSLAVAAGLASCAERAAPPRLAAVRGALVAGTPVTLSRGSSAIVELRDATEPGGAVVAEQRIELDGGQPPIAFTLPVDPGRLAPGRSYALRGGIEEHGKPVWVTASVPVDATAELADVGELPLKAHVALTFATTLRCGKQEVSFGVLNDSMHLIAGDDSFALRPVPGGEGRRYEATTDPTTSFTVVGERAILVLRGHTHPECVPVAPR
jgi:uncharacterized lipoprotein YbaY